ncbi:unnamed protein product [Cuscuta campestris]|nr:unnamed protein product [Cuscuta campestris]
MLPNRPKRIGGDNIIKASLSPIQAAAMAAERRLLDDVWCGSESLVAKPSSDSETSNVSRVQKDGFIESSLHTTDSIPTWQCSACTLLNPNLALSCEACGTLKNKKEGSEKSKVWACKFCTLDNSVKSERCMACGEWRYSYGPPSSSHGPYLGT